MNKSVFLSGIGGIGMANLAALLKEAGFEVSGSDGAVYEPAASLLQRAGIACKTPYAAENVPLDGTPVIIGNAQSRGHVEVETALEHGCELYSFPEFLHRRILQGRHTMVVAGTHGKSTTTACLAHLLHECGLQPGFLVGAMPQNFPLGAALGAPQSPFVVEGDEYDSAFFDKRSKFLHYFPRTLLLGRVEFDHADIFADEAEMLLAFRRVINLLPREGALIYDADSEHACRLAAAAPCKTVSVGMSAGAGWRLIEDSQQLRFVDPAGTERFCAFEPLGRHNRLNALMALAAANSYGVGITPLLSALESFRGIRRRLELLFKSPAYVVYDDFAHHPTAIAAAIHAVRERYPQHRLIAVFEPRSNTMVRNVFQHRIPEAFRQADHVILGTIHRLERIPVADRIDISQICADLGKLGVPCEQLLNKDIAARVLDLSKSGQAAVLFMSNGSFDGAPADFLRLLKQ